MATYDEAIAAARDRGLVRSERDGEADLCCPHPDHEDRNPSARLSRGRDNGVLFTCHSRHCDFVEVMRDGLGLVPNGSTPKASPDPLVTHVYHYADGRPAFEVRRRGTGGNKWVRPFEVGAKVPGLTTSESNTALRTLLYRLPEVAAAVSAGQTVWVVEGEKCADALHRAGVVATTNAGGVGKWRRQHAEALRDAAVIVVADNDRDGQGRRHAESVLATLTNAEGLICPQHHDVADCLAAGIAPDDLLAHLVELVEPEPIPASPKTNGNTPHEDLPPAPPPEPFPIGAVPDPIRSWAEAVALQRQVPVVLPVAMALGLVSGAIARKLTVESGTGWDQECCLYLATAMDTAERKSPVVNKARDPMHEIELEMRNRWERTCEACEALDDPKPPEPGIFLEDMTPEAFAYRLSTWDERAIICTDEGGPLDALAGMYGHLPGTAMQMWLKAHSGSFHRVDRKTQPSFVLRRPVVSIAVAVQPTVLERLAAVPGAIERGLLNRFLLSAPRSLIGTRQVVTPPVPEALTRRYRDLLHGLWWRFEGVEAVLMPTRQATTALVDYETHLEHRLLLDLATPGVRSVAVRSPGQALRLAAVHHIVIAGREWEAPLSLESMEAGIAMAYWYLTEAQRLYPRLLRRVSLDDLYPPESTLRPTGADEVVAFVQRQEGQSTGMRRLHRQFQKRFWANRVQDLARVVEWLEEKGEVGTSQPPATGGRPGGRIVFIPEGHESDRESG